MDSFVTYLGARSLSTELSLDLCLVIFYLVDDLATVKKVGLEPRYLNFPLSVLLVKGGEWNWSFGTPSGYA